MNRYGNPQYVLPRERLSRVVAPYLIPWIGSAALLPASEITRLMWDTPNAAPWAAIGMAGATVGITAVTRVAARPRGGLIRDIATATVACCGTWWIGATFAGPFTRPTFDFWLFLTLLIGGTHNAMRMVRRSGADTAVMDGFEAFSSQVRAMQRARIRKPQTIGGRVIADVEMEPGQPIDDFINDSGRSHLAAHLDVPTSSIRTSRSPESARRGTVEIIPVDHLRDPLPWPGPSAPGASIAEPLVLGEADDGRPLQIWLPGDGSIGRPASHVLIAGMSGAGKTKTYQILAAEVMSRADTETWLIETRKGDQTIGPIRHGATRIATTPEAAKSLLKELVRLIPQRTQWLGERDFDQWEEGCGLPFLVIFIGDAAQVVAGSPEIIDAAEAARSAGALVVLDMQRPSHDRIPVAARSNFGAVLLHGVERKADTKIASETLHEAGARPDLWGATKPGYLYVAAPGVDETRLKVTHRAYLASRTDLRAAIPAVCEDQSSEFAEADTYVEADHPRLTLLPPVDRRMGTDGARVLLDRHISRMAAAGWTELAPADLADVLTETGRSAPWLTGELKARCEGAAPMLRDGGRGRYVILTEETA